MCPLVMLGSENPGILGNITTTAPKIYARNINDTVVAAWLCYKRLRHYAEHIQSSCSQCTFLCPYEAQACISM